MGICVSVSGFSAAAVGVGGGVGLPKLARPAQRQRSRNGTPAKIATLRSLDCLLNHCIGDHPFVKVGFLHHPRLAHKRKALALS